MANAFVRTLLFLSSYLPLGLIFFVLFIQKSLWISIGSLSLGLFGLVGLLVYMRSVQQVKATEFRIAQVQRNDAEAMSYIVSYVIPFFALEANSVEEAIALTIFFAMLGILYVHSNMIHINPVLGLMGYHLYEVTSEEDVTHALIARERIVPNKIINAVKAGDNILIAKEGKNGKP
jgi:hypothetical protein